MLQASDPPFMYAPSQAGSRPGPAWLERSVVVLLIGCLVLIGGLVLVSGLLVAVLVRVLGGVLRLSGGLRALFERENILSSSWYAERLDAKVARDSHQAQQAIEDLTRFYTAENNEEVIERLGIEGRLAEARAWLDKVSSPAYREHLVGTLGLQPSLA